jgi:hypothetical protein
MILEISGPDKLPAQSETNCGLLGEPGGIVACDVPEHASSLKLKAFSSVFAENTDTFSGVAFGWIKKF